MKYPAIANTDSLGEIRTKYMRLLITLLISLSVTAAFGQSGLVKGKVIFENKDSLYATVTVLKLRTGVSTDINGFFSLSIAKGGHKLMISSVGYQSKIIDVNVLADSTYFVEAIFKDPCVLYSKGKLNKNCPICNRQDKVIPIIYGFPIGKQNSKKYYYAGCEVTDCDPTWYCKRDKQKF